MSFLLRPEYFRALIEKSHDAISLISPEGQILYTSPAAERISGLSVSEIIGNNAFEQLHPEDRRAAAELFAQLLHRPEQSVTGQFRYLRRDGATLWLEATATNLLAEPAVQAIVVNYRDITARRQRERELQAIASVSAQLRGAQTRAEMLPIILEQVMDLLQIEGVALALRDIHTNETVIELAKGGWAHYSGLRYPPGEGVSGHVIATGQPYLSNDLVNDPLVFHPERLGDLKAGACVPLIAQGKTIGALWCARGTQIAETDVRLLTAIADITANAIQRVALHEQTRRRAEQMLGVNVIGRTLAETLDLPQIYERLYQAILQLLPDVVTVFISMFDAVRQQITCMFGVQDGERLDCAALPILPLAPPGEGTQSQVIHSRQPLIIHHVPERLQQARLKVVVGEGMPTQSALYVPMLTKGEVIGLVQVQSYTPDRFTQEDADLLALVANTAAIAIKNARLLAETERRLQYVRALHEIDRAITSAIDLRVILNILLDQVISHLNVDAAAVLLLSPHTQFLEYIAGRGFRGRGITRTCLRLGEGHAGRAALERRTVSAPVLAETYFPRAALLAEEAFVSYHAAPLLAKGQVKGVLEVFHRAQFEADEEWLGFFETLGGQAAIAIDNAELFEGLQRSNLELSLAYDATIEGWSQALDLRDKETEGHTRRVTELTLRLARAMGISETQIIHIRRGSLLHDIGKMGVPDGILLKAGPLTPEEWGVMHRHPQYAYNMLSPILYLRPALDIPYCHHEKWDGSGYPQGLKGEKIPLAARIFAIADVWDALTSDRPYRPAWSAEQTREYICAESGKHFDPQVVETFLQLQVS